MLPIEEDEMGPTSSSPTPIMETKELASCLNGSSGPATTIDKEEKDDQNNLWSGGPQNEQRELEKR